MNSMVQSDQDRVKSVYLDENNELRVWGNSNFNQLVPSVSYTEYSFREHLYGFLRDEGWGAYNMDSVHVLEIGCGWGRNFPVFLDMGIPQQNIHGVDLLSPFVEKAWRCYPVANILEGDASRLVDFGKQFDLILIHTVMSAVLDESVHRKIIDLAASHLKPGGLVVVMDIVEDYKEGAVMVKGEPVPFIIPAKRNVLKFLAESAGLSVVCNRNFGLMPRWRSAIYLRLAKFFQHPILLRIIADLTSLLTRRCSHYILIFKKI